VALLGSVQCVKYRWYETKRVAQFLADHPKLHLHFTPTYSSWLNQVELWFGRIEREVVARGVFTSVNDLARELMRYIRHPGSASDEFSIV
jgi:transposase